MVWHEVRDDVTSTECSRLHQSFEVEWVGTTRLTNPVGTTPRKGCFPLGVSSHRTVGRQTTTRKSARFRVGAIVSSPIRPITGRHSLSPRSSTHYAIRRPCGHPCLPCWPDVALGLPRSAQVTELGGSRLFAGDTDVSVSTPSKWTTDHVPFGRARYYKLRLARYSFTTFIGGSLPLTLQPSLAPHPGATPRITRDPSRGFTYPVRWLHCQSA